MTVSRSVMESSESDGQIIGLRGSQNRTLVKIIETIMYSTVFCVWNMVQPIRGDFLHLHLMVFQNSGESGVVDPIPVAKVEVLVDGFVELALGQLLSILGHFFVVKVFWNILRKINEVFLRRN